MAPRRYGFHATLKPPMRLIGTCADFIADAAALARKIPPFALPPLEVTRLGQFLALCLAQRPASLHALADACVLELDAHRRPEDAAALVRRAAGCSPPQLENLRRHGYPNVLGEWRFHMTLTGATATNFLEPPAREFFGATLRQPRRVEAICVFIEPAPGADFMLLKRLQLGG